MLYPVQMDDFLLEEKFEKTPFFMIHPKNRYLKKWNKLITYLLVYFGVIFPYQLIFQDLQWETLNLFWRIIFNFGEIFFFLDIYVNLATCFYYEDKLVKNFSSILAKYCSSYLLIDVLAVFPMEYLIDNTHPLD